MSQTSAYSAGLFDDNLAHRLEQAGTRQSGIRIGMNARILAAGQIIVAAGEEWATSQ